MYLLFGIKIYWNDSLILQFSIRCQNYDGWIGGEPGIGGHGGYTFCGLAAMEIMGKTDLLDIPLLLVMINFLFVSLKNHNKILKCSSILFSVGQHIPNAIN